MPVMNHTNLNKIEFFTNLHLLILKNVIAKSVVFVRTNSMKIMEIDNKINSFYYFICCKGTNAEYQQQTL